MCLSYCLLFIVSVLRWTMKLQGIMMSTIGAHGVRTQDVSEANEWPLL